MVLKNYVGYTVTLEKSPELQLLHSSWMFESHSAYKEIINYNGRLSFGSDPIFQWEEKSKQKEAVEKKGPQ